MKIKTNPTTKNNNYLNKILPEVKVLTTKFTDLYKKNC